MLCIITERILKHQLKHHDQHGPQAPSVINFMQSHAPFPPTVPAQLASTRLNLALLLLFLVAPPSRFQASRAGTFVFDVNRQATDRPVAANGNNRSNLRCVRRGWSPRTRSRGGHGSAFALCRSIHGARVRLRMVMCVWFGWSPRTRSRGGHR